ncbi:MULTISPECIES: TRAP transporter substrate-binding protein [unclassified Halomonas]|uniref:TRAP transporter substrate-binding protein n=1 Tax=unclassified Halomonas TaxID=2609666 RepID=UPI0006DB0A75|nr:MULTISPECIES: TRAP transporter substrate-binding protein [unclassified Halomonas]KPQ20768.1 MAG: TRAP-type transport system substrate-binding component [Halomonas sp. HL-93]SBR45316.1 tripartite ATP-independent transporter solute receptor, DctP family [Halomonas sp. HL-93]SNY97613.1 tripartite ATP-independent transporter solute receptor, DctP family [Halomonas sp. hl-4]
MKTFARSTLALGISLALVSGANASVDDMEPVTLRLAHVVNEQDGFHIAATKFEELVEERTDGKVDIEIHPNASLGDERTLLEGMQIGTVDMGVITNGPVANFVEEMAVFELPFLFPSPEAAYEVLDGPIGQELLDKLSEVNLKGLAYAERGFRNLTNSERAVNTPDDLDGLRIRVMENPVYTDTFRELGANAIPMAWTEALTAMQQGTIDGQENPVNVIHSFNLDETQNYMTLSRHTYAPAIFVMGASVWNQLPEDAQTILEEAAQEAAEHERQVNAEMEAEQLAELREAGMEINDSPDIEAFQDAVQPVYDEYAEQFGDYLPRIREALE